MPVTAGILLLWSVLPDNRSPRRPTGLQSGDLVFLHGRSLRGSLVRLLSGRDDYSHVGIAIVENGNCSLVHADPDSQRGDRVLRESLDVVIVPRRVSGGAVFRVADDALSSSAASHACDAATGFWRDRLPFDHEFDLSTPQKLYCTELVWRAYLSAGIDLRGHDGKQPKRLYPADLIRGGVIREVARF